MPTCLQPVCLFYAFPEWSINGGWGDADGLFIQCVFVTLIPRSIDLELGVQN